jgi:hypothetical protein
MKIPKPLIISLVLFIGARLAILAMPWARLLQGSQQAAYTMGLTTFMSILSLLAPAIWVAYAAGKEKSSRIFWIVLTCFTGVNGLILFYAYHFFLQTKTTPQESE